MLLTANTETVFAIGNIDLKADGPTVVEAPPKMLGFLQDGVQRYLMDIGPLGPDKGTGGKFLVLPPDYEGEFRTVTSYRSRRPPRCSSRCAASRSTGRPMRRSR